MSLEILKKGTSENFLLKQIIRKNFTSKYKDSVLGILWSFFNPLITMALLTAIFSSVFARNIENFPVYFLTGRCVIDFFNSGTKIAMTSLKKNSGILNKIFVPRYVFALGGIFSEFINFLMSMIVLIVIMIVTRAPFHLYAIFSVIPIAILFILILGVGLTLSILCTKFTDIEYLYKIFTSLLVYACAIFYPIDIVPQPIRQYMELNPIYGIIAQFREFVMYGRFPSTKLMLITFLTSIVIFIIGVIIFKKYQNRITLEL
ncbi:polysaccharide/polyol phosphate ABC transporter permease protein [Methanobrevibacter ruminantium M1]|uniref:Polysaccharide/polyol phosphate ABC transporter permease protein n=1 Tax=Methanobrevibacter ruminantium (strain ATCC 35063 / DSM 1093 / JCM 13430 / OCM 146 / M1) TaxID=634498 RepID=D3E445_METRM|nr:ABC transporter permease [Methanobrevibacter ruminantium]ADC47306.1 polysaccharide/polyol phosphate ABC transporter permease protein [Methanobrevibacter ruminantium M1]